MLTTMMDSYGDFMKFKNLTKRKEREATEKYLELGYGCISEKNKDGTYNVTIMTPEEVRLEIIKEMNVNVVTK